MGRAIRFLSAHYLDQPSLDTAADRSASRRFIFSGCSRAMSASVRRIFVGHLTLDHAKAELAGGKSVLESGARRRALRPVAAARSLPQDRGDDAGRLCQGRRGVDIDYGFHDCPFGIALVMATEKGVCGLAFGDEGEEEAMMADMRARWPKANYRESARARSKSRSQIFEHGRRRIAAAPARHAMADQGVGSAAGDPVRQGHDLSQRSPRSSATARRAARVGTAVGRNPISWLIPCHRVLGSDGALHGYHWGLTRKRSMLALEAARTSGKSQDIRHRIEAGLLALSPERRARGAAREDHAVFGDMTRARCARRGPARMTSCSPTTVPPRRLQSRAQ